MIGVGVGAPTPIFEQLESSKTISKPKRYRIAMLPSLSAKFSCVLKMDETSLAESAPNCGWNNLRVCNLHRLHAGR